MNILFLSRWYPYPANNGSKLRIYSLLRGLAQHHEVTLLSFSSDPANGADSPLHGLCQKIIVVPWKPFRPQSYKARLGFFSVTPRSVVDTFSPQMKRHIEQELATKNYDIIVASQIDMAGYCFYFQDQPALFEEVEVGVPYEQFTQATSTWHRLRFGLTWLKHRHYLAQTLRHFKGCTVVSEQERRLLSQAVPGYNAIKIIPNCLNLADYNYFHQPSQPNQLIFTGSFSYYPNYDAMRWYLNHVNHLVQAAVPDVTLTITGEHGNYPLPPAKNVKLAGFVDDVRPLISTARVSLAPIWQGGGTRLKILEAMALRTPVVATSKGAEGLDAKHNQHLLIADTPAAFAEAVTRLLTDPDLHRRLADNAYQLICDKYDWDRAMPHFLSLVEHAARA